MCRFYRTSQVGVFLLLGWVVGCASSVPLSRHIAAAPVPDPFPTPVVVLHGSAEQLGQQQANRLSDSIHLLYDKYLMVFVGPPLRRYLALGAADLFEAKLRPEHQAEVHALALATGIDERETMLGQCFLDLAQLSACSTIALPAGASPDHVARFGRNLDFVSLNIADRYSTVFVVRPDDGRYAYASIGWPGMIGVLSGMNEHGLCLASMEVPRTMRLPTAMPYTLLYRTVLERCRSVPEAVQLLQTTPRQTANNLMLMDAAGTRAVVEITPQSIHVRWGTDGSALISTNHQRDQDADTPGRCNRYDYLHDQSKQSFGEIEEPDIQSMLRHVGNHGTMQSMVFEPANRVLYLATGTSAATHAYHRLDLTPYFSGSVQSN
jgi:predicted choloylglycine hydrolase